MKNSKRIVIFRSKGPINNYFLYKKLANQNLKVLEFPILKIKSINLKKINIDSNDVVITTSFYGIYFLSKLTSDRSFHIYVLGKSSQLLATKLGFKNIIECNGDSVTILKHFIKNKKKYFKNNKGDVIYAGAKDISFDLPKQLKDLGCKVKRYKIYSSEKVNSFTSEFINLVKNRKISWVILLSQKGAKNFYDNCIKIFSQEDISSMKFACISANVAQNLKEEYFKKFFPKTPNLNYIKEIILKNERKYGT